MRLRTFALALCVLAASHASAQVRITPAAEAPSRQMVFYKPSGPYRITNYTVRELIRFAYQLPDTHIVGLPEWADTERFDIEQQFSSEPTAAEVQDLVRNLLALQFNFTTHIEKRDLPALALVRTGTEPGPSLRRSSQDCTRMPPPATLGVTPCELRLGEQGISGVGLTMEQVASELGGNSYFRLRRLVVDRTGLTGRFDLDIGLIKMIRSANGQGGFIINAQPSGMPLAVHLERELGLRLEESTAPVDVLVVDRVRQPVFPR